MSISLRRYARIAKRVGRLLTGRDVLYKYDLRPQKESLGTVYGGWAIAPQYVDRGGEMYSFGVGYDISFDEEMIRRFDLHVHAFDPSPHIVKLIEARELAVNYIFHPFGLAGIDGDLPFYAPRAQGSSYSLAQGHREVHSEAVQLPVRCLESIVKSLRTQRIEVLKMDIEGFEYGLLSSIIHCPVPIKQLLIEFHHRMGVESLQATIDAVAELKRNGYLLFHVSETSSEFSFIHKNFVN